MEGEDYNTFAERDLSGKIDEIEFCGIVDFLVARGKFQPRESYFFCKNIKKINSEPTAIR